jgi:hypothetical protein
LFVRDRGSAPLAAPRADPPRLASFVLDKAVEAIEGKAGTTVE